MYRWLWMGSLAALLIGSTGCLHHNVRGGGKCSTGSCNDPVSCNSCGTVASHAGGCQQCGTAPSKGILGRLFDRGNCGGGCGNCGHAGSGVLGHAGASAGVCGCGGGCRTGCVAGPLGWQQGGLDYSSHLQPGALGHRAAQQLNNRPFTPGPPTGQVAYPYYSVRGPRDFFMDNPPSIGR